MGFLSTVYSGKPAATGGAVVQKKPLNLVLTDKERALRDERWRFCRAVVAMSETSGMPQRKCCEVIAARDHKLYPLLSNWGQGGKSALTYNNVRNWLGNKNGLGFYRRNGRKEYNWDNIDALADRYVRGKQPEKIDERILNILRAAYIDPRQVPMAVAYRETRELFEREFPELPFPTYEQAKRRLKDIPQLVIDSGRHGIDYVMNRDLYMLIRNWDAIQAGQCYFADTRDGDSWVRVPDGNGGWRAARPKIVFVMDARSWYCVGFDSTAEDSPDHNMIRNVFANACVSHGIPDFFYIDNGKDYNKAGFTTPVEINGLKLCIIKSLGIQLVNSQPYRGRSKTVERRFLQEARNFDKRQPSYCGNAPGKAPDGAELWREGDNVMLLPTLAQYNEKFEKELEKFHHTPMSGFMKGKTPHEVFHGANRIQKAPLRGKELYQAFLLPHPEPRKVHHGGCVSFNRIRYYAPELFAFTSDKKVIIKSHILEPGRIHAFTLDDRYICECTAQESTHPLAHYLGDDEDKRKLDEQLVIQGRQRRALIEARKELTGGFYGLSLDQITSLKREQLEGGFKPITVASRRKVKSGDHNIKLLATPEHLAAVECEKESEQALAAATRQQKAGSSEDRREFDEKFTELMAGTTGTNTTEETFMELEL
jgi:hypothetical protein